MVTEHPSPSPPRGGAGGRNGPPHTTTASTGTTSHQNANPVTENTSTVTTTTRPTTPGRIRPTRCEKKKLGQITSLNVVSLNCQGSPGAFRALEALGLETLESDNESPYDSASPKNITQAGNSTHHIIMLQEVSLAESQEMNFRICARQNGYRTHYLRGLEVKKQTQGTTDVHQGGVAILVKRDLPQRYLASNQQGRAQCLSVWTCGWLMVTSYCPYGDRAKANSDHADVFRSVMHQSSIDNWKEKWIWGADHNAPYATSLAANTAEVANGTRIPMDGENPWHPENFRPTRWAVGGRCVDHFISNAPKKVTNAYLNTKDYISDHMALEVTVQVDQGSQRTITQLERTAAYLKPESILTEEWRTHLAVAFDRSHAADLANMLNIELPEDLDEAREVCEEEWQMFNEVTERMCRKATLHVLNKLNQQVNGPYDSHEDPETTAVKHQDIKQLTNRLRSHEAKGGTGSTAESTMNPARRSSENEIRTTMRRHRLARLYEIIRGLKESERIHPLNEELARTITRARGTDTPSMSQDQVLLWAEKEIIREKKEAEKAAIADTNMAIAHWKKKIRTNWQTVGKYLKKETTASPDVTHKGVTLTTNQTVCDAIKDHAETLLAAKHAKMEANGTK